MKYRVSQPTVGHQEIFRVVDSLAACRLTQGEAVAAFEQEFAKYVGARHAVMCSSGTAALHLALEAAGVRPGDDVFVPDLTYVATANAVAYCGARPVLVDVRRDTWCIDLADAERAITPRTSAILPVHLYGVPCDMAAIAAFADKHGLVVVEDAAESLGASYGGRHTGALGSVGIFNFYANKVITTGEGGCAVTDSAEMAVRMRLLRGQGMDPDRRYYHPVRGFNYRMTDIAACVGLAQLARIDEFLMRRRAVCAAYRAAGLLASSQTEESAPWLYTGLVPAGGRDRDEVMRELANAEIETRPAFVPLHRLPMYQSHAYRFPNSVTVGDWGLSLPTYPTFGASGVAEVIEALRKAL